jgi:hypothetical protein
MRERAKLTANDRASAGRINAVVQSLFSGCLAAIHVESDSSLAHPRKVNAARKAALSWSRLGIVSEVSSRRT